MEHGAQQGCRQAWAPPSAGRRAAPLCGLQQLGNLTASLPAAPASGSALRCRLRTPCALRRQHGAACRAAAVHMGSLSASGLRFGCVVARFNDLVTKPLLEGVLEGFERHGTPREEVDVAWVPGSFELAVVAKSMAKSGRYDAVITVGAVVRGATAHFDAVVGAATSGVLGASTDSGIPVIFCVMTTDTMEQALDRAGGKAGNKGYEGALTAIEMANLLKDLRAKGLAAAPW